MNRLKQPSTWAGLAAIAQMIGAVFPAYALALHAITAAAGAAAVALNEKAVPDA